MLAEAANRRRGHWSTLSRSAYLRAYRVEERMDSTASNSNYQGAISAIVTGTAQGRTSFARRCFGLRDEEWESFDRA